MSAEGGGPGVAEPRSIDRIRSAALASFAAQGAAATTLRGVAAAAGVSLGLVQHHFATKAGLIKAVDEYVLDVVITPMAQPIGERTSDSISEVGRRVNRILAEHPDVAAYLGRALVDGSDLGHVVFDRLFEVGVIRWQARADSGEARPDIDVVWAATNALVLALGAVSLRPHIERHLPEPFTAPSQLDRWQTSVDTLLREGLFPPPESS
ncbi:TetR/AcrR family transcriptional regulator [Mycolicibacterium sp. 22603]|uniref:TetR/AcrR family transcriptional regulator n=1 Tax=Mycolicibacterium sp. 22603 TaxID=3453950 RepID=UPI003F84AD61